MPSKKTAPVFDCRQSFEEMLAVSQNINLSLLQAIADEAWNAKPPGGKGRGIAPLFAHIHNVRLMWLVAQKREGEIPEKVDPENLTKAGARKALDASASALRVVIREAAQTPEGRIRDFKPNVAHFVAYLISHEAHHRGQITQLARALGYAVDQKTMFGMWSWNTHRKEAGFGD
jgi:uncharacterized damage-inducible protein DinB